VLAEEAEVLGDGDLNRAPNLELYVGLLCSLDLPSRGLVPLSFACGLSEPLGVKARFRGLFAMLAFISFSLASKLFFFSFTDLAPFGAAAVFADNVGILCERSRLSACLPSPDFTDIERVGSATTLTGTARKID